MDLPLWIVLLLFAAFFTALSLYRPAARRNGP